MRLLCLTSHGDTLNSVRPEAELFIGLQKAGVAVTVMTQGDSVYAGPMREAGIEVVDFAPRRKLSLEAIRRIRQNDTSTSSIPSITRRLPTRTWPPSACR